MLRISRGPCRAPGRLVVPPSHGTPTRAISSFFGSRSIGSRMNVATSPKRGTTMPESGSGNFSAMTTHYIAGPHVDTSTSGVDPAEWFSAILAGIAFGPGGAEDAHQRNSFRIQYCVPGGLRADGY